MSDGRNFDTKSNWYKVAVISIVVFILGFAVIMFFIGLGLLQVHYQFEEWDKMMGIR